MHDQGQSVRLAAGGGWRLGLLGLLLALGTACAQAAEVWGYVDAQGVPRFSNRAEDARYQLFYRSLDGAEPAQESAAARDLRPVQVPTKLPRLLAFMEVSAQYKLVQGHLREAAQTHGIDVALLQALIATESGFDAGAVSGRGAVGLMQIMPATATRYGVRADNPQTLKTRLSDPATNIRVGAQYLADLLRLFAGNTELALAAYNAGEGRIQRAGNKVPDIDETRQYVRTVLQLYAMLRPPSMTRLGQAASAAPALAATSLPATSSTPLRGGASGRANMVGPASTAGLKLALPEAMPPVSLAEPAFPR